MGTPAMSFLMDEFKWRRGRSALAFGVAVLVLGLPTVLFFQQGVFDEYDYWAGTVSLVVFAMLEIILFSWVFGIKKGWAELTAGADIRIPNIYKFILKFVTPLMLIAVFFGSLLRPVNDDWSKLSFRGWELHPESILGQVLHTNIGPNHSYFTDAFYSEKTGIVDSIFILRSRNFIRVTDTTTFPYSSSSFEYKNKNKLVVNMGDSINKGDVLYTGGITNRVFFIDISRFLLTLIFILIGFTVYYAYRKRIRENRI
jgi:branched-subunit amino acid transport protein